MSYHSEQPRARVCVCTRLRNETQARDSIPKRFDPPIPSIANEESKCPKPSESIPYDSFNSR